MAVQSMVALMVLAERVGCRKSTTNSDLIIIANFYLDFISRSKFCPKVLRIVRGNENIYCEDLQAFFSGDPESFLHAQFLKNQRMEAFWSRLKKFKLSQWISFFKSLEKVCFYKLQFDTHKEVIIFCFLSVIQNELNKFVLKWNHQTVRQSQMHLEETYFFTITSWISKQRYSNKSRRHNIAREVLGLDDSPVAKNEDMYDLLK